MHKACHSVKLTCMKVFMCSENWEVFVFFFVSVWNVFFFFLGVSFASLVRANKCLL